MLDYSLSDEFSQDNRIRPYTSGVTRHYETLSTILLYQESDPYEYLNPSEEDLSQFNFLDSIDREVSEITVEGVDSDLSYGSVINNPGDIAIVKLDGSNNY